MGVHSRYLRGNLLFLDKQRWLDAVGPNVVKILDDFQFGNYDIVAGDTSPQTKAGWLCTFVEVGAGGQLAQLVAGADGGALLLTTAGNENDGINVQALGEAFNPSLTNAWPMYFGIRFKVSSATQSDFLAGLCITDTTLTAGLTDGMYFRKPDASTTVSYVLEKNSTETTGTAWTCVADTYVTAEILFDGTNVDFYVDGVLLTRLAQTNLPDDEYLTPSFEFLNGEAASCTITIDWIRALQIQA